MITFMTARHCRIGGKVSEKKFAAFRLRTCCCGSLARLDAVSHARLPFLISYVHERA
jgi:hypothetical protein